MRVKKEPHPGGATLSGGSVLAHDRSFRWLALGFGAAVGMLLYWPILTGRIPLPLDLLASFPPWAGLKAVPKPHSHADVGDLLTLMYPWRFFARQTIRRGALPFWNPHSFGGAPFLANPISAVFYPPNLLYYILPMDLAWALSFPLRVTLLMWFTALFARDLGITRTGALTSGLAFTLCGFCTGWQGWPQVDVVIWLPLILLFILRTRREPNALNTAGLALSGSMVCLAGHPETAVYVALVAAAFAFYTLLAPTAAALPADRPPHDSARFASCCLLALVVATLCCSVQLLPTVQWLGAISRDPGSRYTPRPFVDLLGLLSRDAQSSPNRVGIAIPEAAVYVGALPLLLAPLAAFHRNRLVVAFFAITEAAALVFAYRLLPLRPIWTAMPILTDIHGNRAIAIVDFSLAILAGFGLVAVETGTKPIPKLLTIGVATGLCIVPILLLLHRPQDFPSLLFGPRSSVILLAAAAAAIAFTLVKPSPSLLTKIALLGITALDLGTFSYGHVPFTRDTALITPPPTYAYLKHRYANSPSRICTVGSTAPANIEMLFDLDALAGYPQLLRRTFDLLAPYTVPVVTRGLFSDVRPEELDRQSNAVLSLMNARYILANTYNESAAIIRRDTRQFRLDYSWQTVRIFENQNWLPRVVLIPFSGVRAASDGEALTALWKADFAPNRQALVAGSIPKWLRAGTISKDKTRIEFWFPTCNSVSADVVNSSSALLLLSQAFYPGWRARVDGGPAPIVRADYGLTGVWLPPGRHMVELRFVPTGFALAVALSALGWCGAGALALAGFRRRRARIEPGDTAVASSGPGALNKGKAQT